MWDIYLALGLWAIAAAGALVWLWRAMDDADRERARDALLHEIGRRRDD